MISKKVKSIFVFCLLVLIDQLSKLIVINHFKNGLFFLRGFVGLEIYQNHGFVFGIELGNIIAIVFTSWLIVLFVFIINYSPFLLFQRTRIFFLLVLSGAISNLFDRIFRGYVVDFIRFSPILIFNIADIFILVGLLLLFFQKRELKCGIIKSKNQEV